MGEIRYARAFVESLVEAYGPYPGSGLMADLVIEYLADRDLGQAFAKRLLLYVIENYDSMRSGPPRIPDLQRIINEMPPPPRPKQLEAEGVVSPEEGVKKIHEILDMLAEKKRARPTPEGKVVRDRKRERTSG